MIKGKIIIFYLLRWDPEGKQILFFTFLAEYSFVLHKYGMNGIQLC